MRRIVVPSRLPIALGLLLAAGCAADNHTGNGALLGGAGGAGVGALIGHAAGNTGAGAAIGAAAGALTGGAIGASIDEEEKRNRALIEAQLHRSLAPGAVTFDDVVAMTRAGVAEDVIANHVRANGMVRAVAASDLVYLQQQGVSPRVMAAMQEPPRQQPVVVQQAPPPVIVHEYGYGPWGPRYYYPYPYCPPPRVGFGVSFHH